jgi:hypothetical protein
MYQCLQQRSEKNMLQISAVDKGKGRGAKTLTLDHTLEGGTETLLLAEDDKEVRVLQAPQVGYTVIGCRR